MSALLLLHCSAMNTDPAKGELFIEFSPEGSEDVQPGATGKIRLPLHADSTFHAYFRVGCEYLFEMEASKLSSCSGVPQRHYPKGRNQKPPVNET